MKKTIEIDLDNPSDLKRNITFLQKRRKELLSELGYSEIYFNGSKNNSEKLLPLFDQMLNTDLNYQEKDMNNSYYVYFHCNPLKPLTVKKDIKHLFLAKTFHNLKYEPFYVGKGTAERFKDFNRNDSHRKIRTQIVKFKQEIVPVKIFENLTESKALELETKLIDILGLMCLSKHGILCNLDEGMNSNNRINRYKDETGYIKKILNRNGFK